MARFELILETIAAIIQILYYTLEGTVKAVLPAKYLSKKDISKDTVLVTGAGSGIGRALSISLAKLGCKLVLWDINAEGNQETAAEIKRFGGQVHPYTVDVSKREQVYKVADKVLEEVGAVDILVNNAGIFNGRYLTDCPDDSIQRTVEINTLAHFWTTKAFLPAMMDRDYGHIVAVASTAGLLGSCRATDYCASKFAVVGFMEALALEMKSLNKSINTTVVCLSFVNTPLLDHFQIPARFRKLETDHVARVTMEAIQLNQAMLCVPSSIHLLAVLCRILPEKAFFVITKFIGALKPFTIKGETTD